MTFSREYNLVENGTKRLSEIGDIAGVLEAWTLLGDTAGGPREKP